MIVLDNSRYPGLGALSCACQNPVGVNDYVVAQPGMRDYISIAADRRFVGLAGIPGMGDASSALALATAYVNAGRQAGNVVSATDVADYLSRNSDETETDIQNAVAQALSSGSGATFNTAAYVAGMTSGGGFNTSPLETIASTPSPGWTPVSKNSAGQWVDANGDTAPGVPNMEPNFAQKLLGVPGQVTNTFGLTPQQALQLGLQLSGKAPAPRLAPPPAPGLSTGAVFGIGLALVAGIAYAASSNNKSAPAQA